MNFKFGKEDWVFVLLVIMGIIIGFVLAIICIEKEALNIKNQAIKNHCAHLELANDYRVKFIWNKEQN